MRFTWDPKKAASNLARHGVDFRDAIQIFASKTLESLDERFEYGEERWTAIGLAQDKEDLRRIISARKANRRERERYWQEVGRYRLGSD